MSVFYLNIYYFAKSLLAILAFLTIPKLFINLLFDSLFVHLLLFAILFIFEIILFFNLYSYLLI